MSDISSTILKILSSITSPKAAFKFILISISLTLCWLYAHPKLGAIGIPNEISSITISFLGVGLGSLICDASCWLYNSVQARSDRLKEEKKKAVQERIAHERKIKSDEEFLIKFQSTFEHYDLELRTILRHLSIENKKYPDMTCDTSDLHALVSNKVIYKVANVDLRSDIYSINPLIKEFISTQWNDEIEQGITDFLSFMTPLKVTALELLELNENSFDGKTRRIKKSIFTSKYHLSPVIMTTYDTIDLEFYLYFREGYLKAMEKRLSKEFVDEIAVILK
ncbi:TPA: hypothetical protein ACP7HF_001411 [Yersinia enterocolitica]|nr:hypothetical protein [Yersinia enterocolitica]